MREMIANGPYADRKWLLHTGDAHALYRKLGFDTPDFMLMERPPSGQTGSTSWSATGAASAPAIANMPSATDSTAADQDA